MQIIHYEKRYYNDLLDFYRRMFPNKSEEYFEYQINKAICEEEDNKNNCFVVNDDGNIIGCHLYFINKALIKGDEEKVYWGHDTIVQEEYRGDVGVSLIQETWNLKNGFGCGLSEISYKIHKKLKKTFFDKLEKYLVINVWFYKILWKWLGINCNSKREKYPDKLKVGKYIFNKVSSVKELHIPNNGFWNEGDLDIEFARDEHFLDHRFFNNFNKYYFYKIDKSSEDQCYFVFRNINFHGVRTLSLVDFRYNITKKKDYKIILRAINKIARINAIPIVLTRTTVAQPKISCFPLCLKIGKSNDVVGNKQFCGLSTFVTAADSDADFLDSKYYD